MDYNNNGQNQDSSNFGSAQQNMPQRPVVINELEHKKDSMVTISLVLGILGIVFCWAMVIPIFICLAGLIMGIVSLVKTEQHRGLSVAGIITSSAGLVLSVLLHFLYILL